MEVYLVGSAVWFGYNRSVKTALKQKVGYILSMKKLVNNSYINIVLFYVVLFSMFQSDFIPLIVPIVILILYMPIYLCCKFVLYKTYSIGTGLYILDNTFLIFGLIVLYSIHACKIGYEIIFVLDIGLMLTYLPTLIRAIKISYQMKK